jgi:hypothetical protein
VVVAMTCPCPRPLTPDTVIIECDEFKEHLQEMINNTIEEHWKALLEEWEAEILWGLHR